MVGIRSQEALWRKITVKFGLLYLTDYHPEVHGTYTTYYEQMLE